MAQKKNAAATVPQTEEKQAQSNQASQQPGATTTVDVRIHSLLNEGTLRATASATIAGCFAVRNLLVREGKNGLFVSMPGYKNNKGEYKDICFPVTKELRQDFNNAVVQAYHQELQQTYAQAQAQAQDFPDYEPPEPAMQM